MENLKARMLQAIENEKEGLLWMISEESGYDETVRELYKDCFDGPEVLKHKINKIDSNNMEALKGLNKYFIWKAQESWVKEDMLNHDNLSGLLKN